MSPLDSQLIFTKLDICEAQYKGRNIKQKVQRGVQESRAYARPGTSHLTGCNGAPNITQMMRIRGKVLALGI